MKFRDYNAILCPLSAQKLSKLMTIYCLGKWVVPVSNWNSDRLNQLKNCSTDNFFAKIWNPLSCDRSIRYIHPMSNFFNFFYLHFYTFFFLFVFQRIIRVNPFFCCVMFQYLKKFDLIPVFSEEEFKHWFLPQPGIVDAYIVETDGEITGTKFQI